MTPASPFGWETLRESNCRLGAWLDHMISLPGKIEAAPDCMAGLLSELLRIGSQRRSGSLPATGSDPAWDAELAAYRRHLERLRAVLPSIHSYLLAERARIEAQRARIGAAAEWARASRQTL
jgi:hypothetical protein